MSSIRIVVFTSCVLTLSRAASAGEVDTIFIVSKSENKNQVHYALRVDDACAPLGPAPIRPYWRMFEKGATVREPLLEREVPAYGLAGQSSAAGIVTATLRALPGRAITVRTWRAVDGTCHATSHVSIAGVPARLYDVHVVLKLFAVDYLLLTGWDDAGRTVHERIAPG